MIDFLVEEALIDKYVDVKDKGEGEPIIMRLISDHFLPNERFEEAQSWRNALTDKALRTEAGNLIKAAMAGSTQIAIFRHPKNKDWEDASAEGRSEKTDDQQYHYDRTLKYMFMTQTMLEDIDDVRVCRNEWITFVARNAYTGGLADMGATMETLCQAISDYVEYFLLAGAFDDQVETEEEAEEDVPALNNPLRAAASSRNDILETLTSAGYSNYLDANFIANYSGTTANSGGKGDEMVFTDAGVFLLREKMFGSFNGQVQFIPFNSISSIEIGSDIHTEHAGFTSTTSEFWILTINTVDYQSYARWLYLGKNENEINTNRPALMKFISKLAPFFQLVEGDSWSTSGGFTTSYGFYW